MEPLIVRVEETTSRTATDYAFIRSPVRIGRSAHNDLCLPHPFVSSWHGLIEFDGGGARYTDLGSTNGTLLDGSPIEPRSAVPLGPDSEVVIGSLRFTLPPPKVGPAKAAAAATAGGEPVRGPPGTRTAVPPRVAAPASGAPTRGAVPGAVVVAPTGARTRTDPAPEQTPVAPGGITAMMRKLAAAPTEDFERACRRALFPGAVIGRFELIREIGRGSFGVVFEAKDRQLGRRVAFKAVRQGRESQIVFRQELLQKEAEAVAQLNHPNIVSLHDAGTCESGPYLIMELLRGETLRDRMRGGRIPLAEALEIAIEIAWALDHAHAAEVIHRDLKPANVFLCDTGHVKVLDFGIAHVFGAGAKSAVGTPAYMAPEQWREGPQDARTDVFGAAVMLAETVTGRLPYRVTEDWSAVLDPGARPSLAAPDAPPPLLTLLRRGLSPDPGRRPADGHAWLAALLDVHERLERAQPVEPPARAPSHRPPVELPASSPPRTSPPMDEGTEQRERPPKRLAGPLLLALLALAAALGVLAYVLVG